MGPEESMPLRAAGLKIGCGEAMVIGLNRSRLLKLRSELAAIGRAVGLPAVLFSIETNKTTRLNVVMMKLGEASSPDG